LFTVLWATPAAAAQGAADHPLASARTLYESAQYEDALAAITHIASDGMTATERRESSLLRALCLLAVNRRDEAAAALEEIVRAEPLFVLPAGGTPPRLRVLLTEVRGRLAPVIAERHYAAGKQLFDSAQYAGAADAFTLVLQLAEEDNGANARLKDLNTLAVGFRDLAQRFSEGDRPKVAAIEAARDLDNTTLPVRPPAGSAPAAGSSETGEGDIVAPVALFQQLPPFPHTMLTRSFRPTTGVLQVVVDVTGQVKSATLVQRIHPHYDALLLDAAKKWKYQPATRNGQPVEYAKRIAVNANIY
jgi:hypothetical protein